MNPMPLPSAVLRSLLLGAAILAPACSLNDSAPPPEDQQVEETLEADVDAVGNTPLRELTAAHPPQANAAPSGSPATLTLTRSKSWGGGLTSVDGQGGDSYAPIQESPWTVTEANPLSTFAADVDTASFSNVRRFLRDGSLPPADAVRLEEIVNALRYNDAAPGEGEVFGVTTELGPCPWNPDHMVLRVGVRTAAIDKADVPPCNLVFLLDVSGSMNSPDKLQLLTRAMDLLVDELRPQDRVAIVTYAGHESVALPSTAGDQKAEIRAAIQALRAGGSTAGAAGIRKAYGLAQEHFIQGGVNRVILGTDGDFNVGISTPGELEDLIASKREDGVFLSVLGFGRGNLKDDRMETLADKGNGNYAYIDSVHQARRTLVEEFGATLVTVAKDVKLQVEFRSQQVKSYRLLGYENRMLTAEQFRDDKVDAGEMGAGHTITALYEIVPTMLLDPYDPVATLRLRHKAPDGDTATEQEHKVFAGEVEIAKTSEDFRLATAAAAFALLLRDSEHKGALNWGLVRELTRSLQLEEADPMRGELVQMADQAAKLAAALTARDGDDGWETNPRDGR